jgi:hypothetical protein
MRSQRGATLVEMLVAMAMPALVAGGANGAVRTPIATAAGTVEQVIAQALTVRPGCAVTSISSSGPSETQPLAVYASAFSFSFVTECLAPSTGPHDQLASNSYASNGGYSVRLAAWHGTSSYLASPYSGGSVATSDTITFFFQPDQATARTDDFLLMRQLNTQRPEVVVRNVLTFPGQPFFRYYYRMADRHQDTHQVPGSWLPLWHLRMEHGAVADTGTAARIDLLRAIEVNYSVTNGRTGADERVKSVNTIIPLSSLVPKHPRPCGYDPLFSQASFSQGTPEAAGLDLDVLLSGAGSESRSPSQPRCSPM